MNGSAGSSPTWWWLSVVVLVGVGATLMCSRPAPSGATRGRGTGARRGMAVAVVTIAAVVFSLGTPADL